MPAKFKLRRAKKAAPSKPQNRLRFSTSILRLLGEELNPSPDQSILELIKNAYDADAKLCTVELKSVHQKGGSLLVSDDGNGMTAKDISEGWLVVGDSLKKERTRSPMGRLLVGSKGLGRLGALRMGQSVVLVTRPKKEPGAQYRIEIDWKDFDAASVVEDVGLAIKKEAVPAGSKFGTEIHVSHLPAAWKETDVKRLARSILLLRDPFAGDRSFVARLAAPEFHAVEQFARKKLPAECDFHLEAEVNAAGRATAVVRTASGKELFAADHARISNEKEHPIYTMPAISFELREYNLSHKGFAVSNKQTTVRELKEWISVFGGIRLYHRGVRVLPYGEPKNDWLDINLRRAQHPELRPSSNNSIGRVRIEDPDGVFRQKTDRQGFVESNEFNELRRFLDDTLDWMARERVRLRDLRINTDKAKAERRKHAAAAKLKKSLAKMSPADRKNAESAVSAYEQAHQAEIALKDEVTQLYYTIGTVGTTAAAFAHQTKAPLSNIVSDASLLEDYLGDPSMLSMYREESSEAVQRIHRSAKAIYSYANITLKLLEHEKRHSRSHPLHDLIDETLKLLTPFFELRHTKPIKEYSDEKPKIYCAESSFEAILTNLLTNSLQAFACRGKAARPSGGRKIFIQTAVAKDTVSLVVQDNGPGIDQLSLEDIWIAGKTTTEKGTGLGLAIVKDVVQELRGRVEADAHGEYGGAKFTVTLPLKN